MALGVFFGGYGCGGGGVVLVLMSGVEAPIRTKHKDGG